MSPTWSSGSLGDEGTWVEQRADGAFVVTYHKGARRYTRVIPRPVTHSANYVWRVHVHGPHVRSHFREGNGMPVEQVWNLTEGSRNQVKVGGCLIPVAMGLTLLLALLAA